MTTQDNANDAMRYLSVLSDHFRLTGNYLGARHFANARRIIAEGTVPSHLVEDRVLAAHGLGHLVAVSANVHSQPRE